MIRGDTTQINSSSATANWVGFAHAIKSALLVLGVASITVLALLFIKPGFAEKFHAISPFAEVEKVMEPASVDGVADEDKNLSTAAPTTTTKQQQSVANWLAKRYRVANEAAHLFVATAYSTAQEFKIDPLLILSVMAIESGFNPLAESAVGAQGLMQVMANIHKDKFTDLGGVKAALNPEANIRVGTQILKEYVTRGGSVQAGLKMYVGAALLSHDGGYGSKVLAEYKRLQDVANGKSVPQFKRTVAVKASLNHKIQPAPNSNKSSSDNAETSAVAAT